MSKELACRSRLRICQTRFSQSVFRDFRRVICVRLSLITECTVDSVVKGVRLFVLYPSLLLHSIRAQVWAAVCDNM